MSAQTQIAAAVAQRGYLDGWTADEVTARQVVKLAEELGELASTIETDSPLLAMMLADITKTAQRARMTFDTPSAFVGATCHTLPAIYEATDCAVVLAVLAHALEIPDIMFAASVKANNDVARGVRNGK